MLLSVPVIVSVLAAVAAVVLVSGGVVETGAVVVVVVVAAVVVAAVAAVVASASRQKFLTTLPDDEEMGDEEIYTIMNGSTSAIKRSHPRSARSRSRKCVPSGMLQGTKANIPQASLVVLPAAQRNGKSATLQ